MKLSKEIIFNGIIDAFNKNISLFINRNILSERDWQRQLYCDLKDCFLPYKELKIELEYKLPKSGNEILWISPKKYAQKCSVIDVYCQPIIDAEQWVKIEFKKLNKSCPDEVKDLVRKECKRSFSIDILIKDKTTEFIWAVIELKLGPGITGYTMYEDFRRLLRIKEMLPEIPILISAGYDTIADELIWRPVDEDCAFQNRPVAISDKVFPEKITTAFVENSILEYTKFLYEWDHYTEATWQGEMIWYLSPLLPEKWHINGERKILNNKQGSVDLCIYDSEGCLKNAIELKSHYESPFPLELKNDLYRDKKMQNEFFHLSQKFIYGVIDGKVLKSEKGAYPKNGNKDYVNSDFFDKIVELYFQYRRLIEAAEKSGTDGIVVFIDHNNDFSLRTWQYGFNEEQFVANFKFRKALIEEIIGYNPNRKVKFFYFYKLNSINGGLKCVLL